ncbi:non-ribosomal peptide synthetase, partial [Chitinimonas koreensis]|uniref:non-ribosomal peptide synthetase n=2 Tax=Chitinimonas koreensis TaxID=356302 RepID=UPI0012FC9259
DVLRRQLAAVLPEHMVPAAYVAVAHWPLTANGKLDRKALPEPDGQAFGERRYAAPEGPVETALAAIWAEVLGLERIGRHDHFFELGGHSLLALRVLERMRRQGLHADVRVLFGTPTLAALAAAVGNESSQDIVPPNLIESGCERITPELLPLVELSQDEIDRIVAGVPGGAANVQDIYPLAPLQEGILFHHLMAKEHDPYLLASLIRFRDRGRLDAYLEALEAVIARHDILRTAFAWEGLGEPVQVVWRQAPLLVDECELDPTQGDAGTQLRQKAERRLPLQQAPLMRLLLARDPHTGQWLALKQFHHIIDDNTSLKHLNAEIRVHLAGGADQLPPALPFRDYVAQTRRGAARAEHEAFFRKMLGGIDAPTAPFGLLDVRGDGHRMQQVRQAVDAALSQRLRAQAQALGVSAASLFHVAWGQVLARTTGRSAVVFGTVLFGRMQGGEGSDRILGPFINTLPLRVDLGETGAAACVRQTHQALTELIRHEHASLALAQRCSAVAPPAPLFTSLLNYRHGATLAEAAAVADAAGLDGIEHLHTDERTNYPLTLSIDDLRDDFRLTVQVCGEVDAARVCGMLQHALASLADALEQAPVRALGRLDVLPDEERRRLLVEWNGPAADYPRDRCLHQLFEDQAARHPAAVAVACEDAQLSYGELNARANRLARHLQAQGVGPDRLVAICLERSFDTVVALLAVLKAGGAYVPLDPAYPAERLAHMLRDSAPAAVLSHGPARAALAAAMAELPAAPPAIDLDADAAAWADRPAGDLAAAAQASDLAYVIYTSGSTGLPKGAMNEHRAVVNRLMWMQDEYRLGRDDAVLQKTPFSFDVSVWEFFWPLLAGARLVMARPGGHKDPAYLARTIAERRITTLHFVPSMLEVFLQHPDAAQCTSLRHVVCSGEALPAALAAQARAALPEAGLHNLYGPTEAAVDVTAWTCPRDGVPPVVPIGRPIANTAIYILDALQQPVPQGVAGEIHIGGVQVGRGYLNRPELTAERFPADPFSADPRARMYRTGDLGRWLADGQIEYLGRNDFQVKLRGFRIELGEIEARLAACPGVQSAVVLAREDQAGNPRLVGYFVAAGDAPADEALRKWLGAALPDYMVPAAFVPLARWPLTPNGKLDRKALPAPEAAALDARAYVAPRTPIEAAMAEIWADVLRLDRVGVQDNFFDLGGHSLLAARVATRIQESLGVELPLRVLFDSPTIEDVLEYIFAEFEDAQA